MRVGRPSAQSDIIAPTFAVVADANRRGRVLVVLELIRVRPGSLKATYAAEEGIQDRVEQLRVNNPHCAVAIRIECIRNHRIQAQES